MLVGALLTDGMRSPTYVACWMQDQRVLGYLDQVCWLVQTYVVDAEQSLIFKAEAAVHIAQHRDCAEICLVDSFLRL